jgi:hypothetical protein
VDVLATLFVGNLVETSDCKSGTYGNQNGGASLYVLIGSPCFAVIAHDANRYVIATSLLGNSSAETRVGSHSVFSQNVVIADRNDAQDGNGNVNGGAAAFVRSEKCRKKSKPDADGLKGVCSGSGGLCQHTDRNERLHGA